MTFRSYRKRALIALLIAIATATGPMSAIAAPADSKRAQAEAVRAQIAELDDKIEMASEDYNDAQIAYQAVTVKLAKTERRLADLSTRQKSLEKRLSVRAGEMYRKGPLGTLDLLFGATTFEEFVTAWDLLKSMNEQDAGAVAAIKTTKAEMAKTRAELKRQQAEAKKHRDVMLARKRSIEQQLAERKRRLAGLEDEIERLEAEERERERRAWTPPPDLGDPVRAPRGSVVQIAMSKLGAPYRWGAGGPDAFDCSGFTMWVYAQVGVSLPHSSRAQYGCGERVSRANLRPGDLVFFGRSRIHHVGIYVGGNRYIHAPHTGDVVRISSLDRADYVGACRP
ncbi:NlpC/P60 family protein [Coriobacteriia bacterium Es71-Z0120]|uniref:C40 family peptidase n=1 Tax=Parvivirga hydrogeniphila TaxID=2939460 RepID=UPI0022608BE1|nr:C40 family peptidase [Parvivirga hydrogeniphila]MCL4078479.1 NlpC/P60 family protein [Parvivirga hydrogeniphila]